MDDTTEVSQAHLFCLEISNLVILETKTKKFQPGEKRLLIFRWSIPLNYHQELKQLSTPTFYI